MKQELLVPRAGWLLLEHAQPLGEAFSNVVQPTHTQATAPGVLSHGESDGLSFPSLPAAELGWHLGTCLLIVIVTSAEREYGLESKCPCCRRGYCKDFKGQTQRLGLSLCGASLPVLCCNITEAWQMPLSAPSPNGNIQQLSSSCLSPGKSVQKLMAQDISYSCVAPSPELLC